jgi:hypothetical protein
MTYGAKHDDGSDPQVPTAVGAIINHAGRNREDQAPPDYFRGK